MTRAQPATVTWAFTRTPTACGSGVDLVVNGGGMQNYTMARIPSLGTRALSFQILDRSRSFTTDTAVTLQLVDKCLGRPISAGYSTKITVVHLDGGLAVVLILLQRILDIDGNLFDQNNVRVGSGYYLDAAGALKSPAGLVASGGGNVVALPDFRLQSAPDRIVRGLGGRSFDRLARAPRSSGGAGGALVASGGGNIVQTAVGGPIYPSAPVGDPMYLPNPSQQRPAPYAVPVGYAPPPMPVRGAIR